MLNKSIAYRFMTTKQLNKRVNKIKAMIDNEKVFEKRLQLLEELAIIVGVLLRRCSHNVKVVNRTMDKLNDLQTLVK